MKEGSSYGRLSALAQLYQNTRIEALFKEDARRFERFSLSAAGITLDYSKNLVTDSVFTQLLALAKESQLGEFIEQVFNGAAVNFTEQRSVLHMALRGSSPVYQDVVAANLQKQKAFVAQVLAKQWLGITGKPIQYIVHIGIGGSHLGPEMVVTALEDYFVPNLQAFFISNLDEKNLQAVLKKIVPEQTLFIIASKTFTTKETLVNAEQVKKWFLQRVQHSQLAIQRHFVAVTAAQELAVSFGILPDNVFRFEKWVGGRFSLWSSVGLVINLMIGNEAFTRFLNGAKAMDEHFLTAPFEKNLPVILGLIGIWNLNFLNCRSLAVVPYSYRLRKMVNFLQQIEMESNGKTVNRERQTVDYLTNPVVWGGTGTDSQHSFHQALMQGNNRLTVDFIFPVLKDGENQRLLFANCLAQSRALMVGCNTQAVLETLNQNLTANQEQAFVPYKVVNGNVASNLLLLDGLTPETVGALIALYEHKVLVQGAIWQINSFDQWGVELGKNLAKTILPVIQQSIQGEHLDSSTLGLIKQRQTMLVKYASKNIE